MKKIILALFAVGIFAAASFAYNLPVQGENLFYLAHPEMLTSGVSTAGGGLLSVTPASTTINPALGAMESRITLDLGYSASYSTLPDSNKYGQAFGTGIIVPTDWCSIAGEFEGIFFPFPNMNLGNSLNLKTSASKQILDKLYVGVGVGTGFFWGYGRDWSLTADIGALYYWGNLAFLKNLRIGASVNNIGKVYNCTNTIGVNGQPNKSGWNGFPYFPTIRSGVAADLIDTENFRLGLSLDVTAPLLQNFIIDSGVQIEIMNFVKINSSWEYNSREATYGRNSWFPTLGVVFKFNIGTDFMKKPDWSTSEISPSVAWKNIDRYVDIFSSGAVVRLGELDTEGPVIEME